MKITSNVVCVDSEACPLPSTDEQKKYLCINWSDTTQVRCSVCPYCLGYTLNTRNFLADVICSYNK